MTWKDVFDSDKLRFKMYHECIEVVKNVGYKYMAFNGYVFSVYDTDMENPLFTVDKLEIKQGF